MTKDEFWQLIARSRHAVEDTDEQAAKLTLLLMELSPRDIFYFSDYLEQLHRYDVLAVRCIVWKSASHNSFLYFRAWIVGQGRSYFKSVLADAENAAKRVKDLGADGWGENLLPCVRVACEEKMGRGWGEYIGSSYKSTGQLQGPSWEETDLLNMCLRLWQRFW